MSRQTHLYVDQYGRSFFASTVRELREKIGGGKVSIMYRDKADGSVVRIGYVIGQHWLTCYQPVEKPETSAP